MKKIISALLCIVLLFGISAVTPTAETQGIRVVITTCDNASGWYDCEEDTTEFAQGNGSVRLDLADGAGMYFIYSTDNYIESYNIDVTGTEYLLMDFYTEDVNIFKNSADCGINITNSTSNWHASDIAVTAATLKAIELKAGWNQLVLPYTYFTTDTPFDRKGSFCMRFYAVGLTGEHIVRVDNLRAADESGLSLPDPVIPEEEPPVYGDTVSLGETGQKIFEDSYKSLIDRIDERGFAATSLDGGVFTDYGMFTRDAATQALAHIANGDYIEARKILRYILSYHANSDYPTIVRYISPLQDEEYGNFVGKNEELTIVTDIGADNTATCEIPDNNEIVTGVKVFVKRNSNNADKLSATLVKKDGNTVQNIDTKSISADRISSDGGWLEILFELPLEKTMEQGVYFLTLSSDSSKAGTYSWYGVDGELSYIALKSELVSKIESENWPQSDCNSMIALAWARFVKEAPKTAKNIDFIEKSYPLVKEFSLHYVYAEDESGKPYWNEEMGLLREPCLEHSRPREEFLPAINTLFNSYNLWSLVFADQAFYELADIAQALGDFNGAKIYRELDDDLVDGIYNYLVVEFNGVEIYAELLDCDNENKLIPGFSWINLTPAVIDWHAVDDEIMKNTIDMYYSFNEGGNTGKLFLDSTITVDENGKFIKRSLLTYGETAAASALYYFFTENDAETSQKIMELVTKNAKSDGIYFETVNYYGTRSDIGNASHCSWMCYAVIRLTKEIKNIDITFGDSALPERVAEGTTLTLPSPTRPMYEFKYWQLGDKTYSAGESVKANESMKFTAVWEKIATYGDVNTDGDITAADALLALQAAVKKIELSDSQQKAADVDSKDGITAGDALCILQYAVGKITYFPIEQIE